MKLQVALDIPYEKKALEIAEAVYEYAHILEAGTPLLKSCGARIIRELKQFGTEVLADTKTVDAVELEAEIVKSQGADYFTVLAVSPKETREKASKIEGIKKVIDLIGVENKVEVAKELQNTFDVVLIHTGIDEGVLVPEEYKELKGIKGLAVAGGITEKNLKEVLQLEPEIIVIGRYITMSEDPKATVKKIVEEMECI